MRKIKKKKQPNSLAENIQKKPVSLPIKILLGVIFMALFFLLLHSIDSWRQDDIRAKIESEGGKVISIKNIPSKSTPFSYEYDSKYDSVVEVKYIDKDSKEKIVYVKYSTNEGGLRWRN